MDRNILVIFDFFGVICSEVAPFWFAERFSPEDAVKIKAEIVGAADRGLLGEEELFSRLSDLTGEAPNRILSDWLALAKIDRKVVDWIDKNRAHYRITLLSNAPRGFLRRILEREHLDGLFDKILISSEVGLAKPDPAMFRLALLPDEPETVFIDDNPLNVTASERVGIRGILYRGFEQFEKDFNAVISG